MKTMASNHSPQLVTDQARLPEEVALFTDKHPLHVWFGQRMVEVAPAEAGGLLQMSSQDWKHLGIPPGRTWRYHLCDNRMCLGPFMGILTEKKADTSNHHRPFGSRTGSYREISLLAEQTAGMVCVFSPGDIDLQRGMVRAYVYKTSEWQSALLPLPAVIYNRISTRGHERHLLSLLAALTARGHCVFNTRFINKPEVYRALSGSPSTAQNVPQTMPFGDKSLAHFADKYSSFFLKPAANALGKGILKVEWDGRHWWCRQQRAKEVRNTPLNNLQSLKDHLLRVTSGKQYLIQQAIDLPGWDGRVFDIRSLVQKDGRGEWTVLGMGARVSSKGRYLTHVPNGGEVWPLDKALERALGSYDVSKLENVLLSAARVLDSTLGINLGILTADIGISQASGTPYILEMNSKPWRFDEPNIREASHRFLLDYVFYLECNMLETGGTEIWPR